ncbi:MAG: hypothetical protein ABI809_06920 [Caldimonas sp.]
MKLLLVSAALSASLQCAAQAVAAPDRAATPTPAARRDAGEPEVRHTVIEDDNTRIDELRVRGVPQRIVVTSKGARGTSYEIITGDGSRDLSDGANTSRGAAGKRVWRVLNF